MDALARRFKAAGSSGLREHINDQLEAAGAKLRPDIERSALAMLPRRNGLAALVARSRITVERTGETGVKITASGTVSLDGINEGRLSHPVFGRGPFVSQNVPPGYFEKPIQARERDLGEAIEDAVIQTGRDIL